MRDEWIIVPGWDRFQHYRDRAPTWIKVYTDLAHRDEYLMLTPTARALLHGIWLLYALHDGKLRAPTVQGALKLRATRQQWKSLTDAGFIEFSASKPLALRARTREVETETDPPKSPRKKRGDRKVTGWRTVRGTHGMTVIPDPNGTDPAPTIGRTIT